MGLPPTDTYDRIEQITLSLAYLPLAAPVSDAKVSTGRQKPLTEVAFLFAEIDSAQGPARPGLGFTLSEQARVWTRARETFR